MITGLFSASSGMLAQLEHQDIIAHNMANVGTAGFRKQRMIFRSFPDILLQKIEPRPPQGAEEGRQFLLRSKVGTGTGIEWAYVDFATAQVRDTGRASDLALLADGFFSLETPKGVRYTRNGAFFVDATDGVLKSVEGGHPVLTTTGTPLVVESDAFTVNANGEVLREGQPIGTLAVIDFRNRDLLAPEGAGLFRFDGQDYDQEAMPPERLAVAQGRLEMANADPMLEMVYLLDSYRNYEANQRTIATLDRTLERLIADVGTL